MICHMLGKASHPEQACRVTFLPSQRRQQPLAFPTLSSNKPRPPNLRLRLQGQLPSEKVLVWAGDPPLLRNRMGLAVMEQLR